VRSLMSLDHYEEWCEHVRRGAAPNTTVCRTASPAQRRQLIEGRMFDVIVVDDGSGDVENGRALNGDAASNTSSPAGSSCATIRAFPIPTRFRKSEPAWAGNAWILWVSRAARSANFASVYFRPEACEFWPVGMPKQFV
jgi:hypothetical protein